MASIQGPNIIDNNLVFYYDTMNVKSYKGEPTTNILPTANINGYPTIGNGWGTYNTNQYNNNTYFSISAIVSVVGDLVTTTTAHNMRTYDVMNPQSTGGGVTAGVNYFIKAVSTTSFTLHAYNGSQDGSQGYSNSTGGVSSTFFYKVHESIATDTRVSVNATSFPTMWKGNAHQPNSGLVKEIITGGFDVDKFNKTDCIRLHWYRPDGVTDAMAYGVDPVVTPSSVYTVSFWTRAVSTTSVGKSISYQIYNYTGGSNTQFSFNATLGAVGVWEKKSMTFTPLYGSCISYWFPNQSAPWHCDIANIQFELKSHATPFTIGTRTNTDALLPLVLNPVSNVVINLSAVSFDSNAEIVFDGTNDVIDIGTGNTFFPLYNFTLETWVKCSGMGPGMSLGGLFAITYGLSLYIQPSGALTGSVDDGVSSFTYVNTTGINIFGSWRHVVFTNDGSVSSIYVDGVFNNSSVAVWSGVTRWPTNNAYLGRENNNTMYHLLGSLALPKIYNKCLTPSEVLQNYNATKNKFI
jgi:hypothetical protein